MRFVENSEKSEWVKLRELRTGIDAQPLQGLALQQMAQIIAIANQKGGVGKTTTAAAFGDLLARGGRRVLLIDCDPQASLTQGLQAEPRGVSLADVIGGAKRGTHTLKQITQTIRAGLDLAPAHVELSACELGLVSRIGRESILKQAIQSAPGYDVCLLDCPPSLGLLTINALTAAGGVIVPALPAAPDLRGVRLFTETLEQIRNALNPALELIGVLIVQYDPRLIAHRDALQTITAAELPVLGTIPRSVKAQEASAARQPVTTYAPDNKTAAAYQATMKGVFKWLKNKNQA